MINVPYSVKKALKKGIYRINYKINVLNSDGTIDFTMDNASLVSDSVNIDERMCSGDILKFGLCEGSSLEFQYFDKPNLYGRRLQVLIEVEYPTGSTTSWYSIPMGFFEVKKCSRQAATGIIKVTAYNKLQSEYLDAEATDEVKALVAAGEFGNPGSITMYMLLEEMLSGYRITPDPTEKIEQTLTFDFSNPVGRMYRMYNNHSHMPLDDYFEFYTLQATFSFQLNTLDDYYRLDLNIDGFDRFTQGFRPTGVYIKPDEDAEPMLIDEAIAYNDEYGDGSLGDALHGTVKLVKAEDHSANYFAKRCGMPAETSGPGMDTNNIMAEDYAGCYQLVFTLPVWMQSIGTPISRTLEECILDFRVTYGDYPFGHIYRIILSDADSFRLTTSDVEDLDKVTLRELQSAVYELQCQYGQIDRETDLFKGVELNKGGLYPRDDLYPSNSLYPSGASLSGSKAMYSKLWADEGNIRKWRKLVISYKGLDDNNNAVDKIMELVVDPDGTDDYLMDDNWLFKNLVWDDEDVETYANAMVAKMQDVTWFPFEMWCAGLPYIETGDMIEIPLEDKHYTSYVLQRQLKGIQDLQDTYINGTLDIF